MMSPTRVALATPHPRYDALEGALRAIHGLDVLRVRTPGELDSEDLERFAPSYVFFPHWSSKIPARIFESHKRQHQYPSNIPGRYAASSRAHMGRF